MKMTELECWNRFRSGDAEAFAGIYELYVDQLYRYGMKIVSDKDIVMDSIQDIFVKLFRLRSSSRFDINPKLYLFRSFRGQLFDNIRKENRSMSLPVEEMPFNVEYKLSEDISMTAEMKSEMAELYNRAIEAMTPRQKEAVYLHYTMGLSFEEVASMMDMNVQSTRNLIFRGISKIRKIMPFAIFLLFFK